MKKALMIISILLVAVVSTACINNIAVQELNNKAMEYMQKGDYEAAMSRLQASLDLDSSMYQTYYNLGVAAINANKYKIAIEALENGIKIKPDYYDFYYSLGVAQIGMADEMLDDADVEENVFVDTEKARIDIKRNISPAQKAMAMELRKAATDNLRKYLASADNIQNKEEVEEMIKQSEEATSESLSEEQKD